MVKRLSLMCSCTKEIHLATELALMASYERTSTNGSAHGHRRALNFSSKRHFCKLTRSAWTFGNSASSFHHRRLQFSSVREGADDRAITRQYEVSVYRWRNEVYFVLNMPNGFQNPGAWTEYDSNQPLVIGVDRPAITTHYCAQ